VPENLLEVEDRSRHLFRSSKEMINHAVCLTRFNCPGESGRLSLAKRIIATLQIVVSIFHYPSSHRNVWEIENLSKQIRQALPLAEGKSKIRPPPVLTFFLRSVWLPMNNRDWLPQELVLLQFVIIISIYN